jgi:hypothetical protein
MKLLTDSLYSKDNLFFVKKENDLKWWPCPKTWLMINDVIGDIVKTETFVCDYLLIDYMNESFLMFNY